MKYIFLLTTYFLAVCASAATVDTIIIRSSSMKKEIKCVVIKPDTYAKTDKAFPAVYLLHGYDGSYSNWISRVPALKNHADQHQLLIICPDGHRSGWYINSPVDSTMLYETYISTEVPEFIDRTYKTIKSPKGRAITGLSMGGYGALFIGLRHTETFGACGSMSGALLIEDLASKYGLQKKVGDTTKKGDYRNFSILMELDGPVKPSAILIDCGISDPLIQMNRVVHEILLQRKIPHEYTERAGNHDWTYWANASGFHMLFFKNFFERK